MSRHLTKISHSRMKPGQPDEQALAQPHVRSSMIVTLPGLSRTKSQRMTAPATQKHTMTPLSIVVPIAESRFGGACGASLWPDRLVMLYAVSYRSGALALLLILVQIRVLRYAYMRLGVSSGAAFFLLFASLFGRPG
jgi:hypothetical protein